MQKVNEGLQQMVKNYDSQNYDETALGFRGGIVAMPETPAYTDGMKRRLDVYTATSKMVQEVLGSAGGKIATAPAFMAASIGKEISDTFMENAREPELIRDIEVARMETEYVYPWNHCSLQSSLETKHYYFNDQHTWGLSF